MDNKFPNYDKRNKSKFKIIDQLDFDNERGDIGLTITLIPKV